MASILDRFKEVVNDTVIDTSKKIRVGIIGTGWIAEAHMDSYLKQPDVEVVAGADLVEGKAEAFFEKFGVEAKCYSSHKEMLDDESLKLDAVSICTYNRTHAECAIYALNKGVNVLLEKPMCVTLEEAVAIREAEKASGKVISIGFQSRLTFFLHQQTVCVLLCDALRRQQPFYSTVDGVIVILIGNTQVLENAGPTNCMAGDVVKS